jgi:hypothetical protein
MAACSSGLGRVNNEQFPAGGNMSGIMLGIMSSERALGQKDASVSSWAEGEPLNSLCHEFYPEMLAIAHNHLGSQLKTRMDARDIVQTAFGEVLQRAGPIAMSCIFDAPS